MKRDLIPLSLSQEKRNSDCQQDDALTTDPFVRLVHILERQTIAASMSPEARKRIGIGLGLLLSTVVVAILFVVNALFVVGQHVTLIFAALTIFFFLLGLQLITDGLLLARDQHIAAVKTMRWKRAFKIDETQPGFAEYYQRWCKSCKNDYYVQLVCGLATIPGGLTLGIFIDNHHPTTSANFSDLHSTEAMSISDENIWNS